ncbi:MAG: UDP-N-acetylmuramoyl-tripeptide--D-alanyl-D-alanine ligase [Flavobacteriales bacterium]|nr:UDP-N-acetylmuramoyl-tripeptide--D-alanyl-D-alanine ligase [Flavobacteriales bacterium]
MNIERLYQLFLKSDGISTDTRKLKEGSIFFALKGGNFNGNKFAEDALKGGCQFAVIDEKEYKLDERFILVDDVLVALQQLANHHRKQFDIPIIGITGSNGKTTSKELMGAVLEQKYKALITEGNLNNHLGVPFTLLRLTKEHEIAIIEMGANKPGDIKELAEIAEPTHGVITNIGAAHIEGFGSLEGVVKTKTELYRFIEQAKGTIIYNGDDKTLVDNLPEGLKYFTYGSTQVNLTGDLLKLTPYVHFQWAYGEYHSPELKTKLVGRYNFTNFLLAVAIGKLFEVDDEVINEALTTYVPSNNRSQVSETDRNTLIVDCYNANATSMKAAIESFSEIDHDNKMVILGDMLELGSISEQEHQKIVDLLQKLSIEKALLVGTEFQKVLGDYPIYVDWKSLIDDVGLSNLKDHLILLKGSRGIKLEELIQYL